MRINQNKLFEMSVELKKQNNTKGGKIERQMSRKELTEFYVKPLLDAGFTFNNTENAIGTFNNYKPKKKEKLFPIIVEVARHLRPGYVYCPNYARWMQVLDCCMKTAYNRINDFVKMEVLKQVRYSKNHKFGDCMLTYADDKFFKTLIGEYGENKVAEAVENSVEKEYGVSLHYKDLALLVKRYHDHDEEAAKIVDEIENFVMNSLGVDEEKLNDMAKKCGFGKELNFKVEGKNELFEKWVVIHSMLNNTAMSVWLGSNIEKLNNLGIEMIDGINFTYSESGKHLLRVSCRPTSTLAKLTKEERAKKYPDAYEFDIHASIPNILAQLANSNPKKYRYDKGFHFEDRGLYEVAGFDRSEVKQAVLKTIFGKSLKSTLAHTKYSLMFEDGLTSESADEEIERITPLYQKVEAKLNSYCMGEYRTNSNIFLVESYIYTEVAVKLAEEGKLIGMVYDCFLTTEDCENEIKDLILGVFKSSKFKVITEDLRKDIYYRVEKKKKKEVKKIGVDYNYLGVDINSLMSREMNRAYTGRC